MITLWCRLNLDPFGTLGRVIVVEDWAEIRRLYSGEGLPIKEIVRRLGISRNTVRAALRSDRPPEDQRPPAGALVDAFEPQIRVLLAEVPGVPGAGFGGVGPGVVGGVPADAGDGDRGAGGLAAFRVDLPRAGVGAATGVSGCRPGAEDLVSAGRDRAV